MILTVRGTGRVVHVQEKLATIESDKYSKPKTRVSTVTTQNPLLGSYGSKERSEEVIEDSTQLPFEYPRVGDFAKRV